MTHAGLLKAGLRQESECLQDRRLKGKWVNTVGFALLQEEYEAQTKAAGMASKDSQTGW